MIGLQKQQLAKHERSNGEQVEEEEEEREAGENEKQREKSQRNYLE